MKNLNTICTFTFLSFVLSGCSGLQLADLNSANRSSINPLKTEKDIKIEKVLTSGTWQYERQSDDCEDTNWVQNFYPNRYYKSVGAACLIPHAFTVDAESWHLKNQILYVTNLAPESGEDIILRYGVDYLDTNKLVLSSGGYKYTFIKQ